MSPQVRNIPQHIPIISVWIDQYRHVACAPVKHRHVLARSACAGLDVAGASLDHKISCFTGAQYEHM